MYCSPNIVTIKSEDQIDRAFNMHEEIGKLCNSLVLNLVDNIKMNHEELRCDGIYRIKLIQGNILYFSILLHSFNTEYLFFCPSM
jgi:hypothetical protein